jgi:hypothetical protein
MGIDRHADPSFAGYLVLLEIIHQPLHQKAYPDRREKKAEDLGKHETHDLT